MTFEPRDFLTKSNTKIMSSHGVFYVSSFLCLPVQSLKRAKICCYWDFPELRRRRAAPGVASTELGSTWRIRSECFRPLSRVVVVIVVEIE